MFELLLTASLTLAPAPPAYTNETLYGFVALANDRIVDGYSYTDGHGVLSAGLLFSTPAGFFASSELASYDGNGVTLPAEQLVSLESAAGWRFDVNADRYSITLLDYRFPYSDSDLSSHHGIALGYRRGAFALEYVFEADKPYSRQIRESYQSDVHRLVLSWSAPAGDNSRWTAGLGSVEIDGTGERHHFASGDLQWRWQQFDWQLMLVHARDRNFGYGGENAGGTELQLRISKSFRLR